MIHEMTELQYDDDLCLIAYDAVYLYADEDLSTYSKYQLTYQAVRVAGEEIETEQARYTRTTSDEWEEVIIDDGQDGGGRTIDPIDGCSW